MVRCQIFAISFAVTAAASAEIEPPPPRVPGWIWSQPDALSSAQIETRYFRREFDLKQVPAKAEITIGADNTFRLLVNGVEAASGNDWTKPVKQDIRAALHPGRNALAAIVTNEGGPAWFYMEGDIRDGEKVVSFATDSIWRWSPQPRDDSWVRPGFRDVGFASNFKYVSVLGDGRLSPQIRELFGKAQTVAPIAPPMDWSQFRERQRKDLAATTRPADPPGDSAEQPVDRFMKQWWADAQSGGTKEGANAKESPQATSRAVCEDATFARRAYLDATGLLPAEDQLKKFISDINPKKRGQLVESLLANKLGYAQGWMPWWCDLLRNDEQTDIDGLRKPITLWLFNALKENSPYDQMVAELLNPGPNGPDGYLKGINWRGIVNASQRPPVQAAQNVGQVFLAASIKCASCHDHFTKPILLEDSYGLASFFSTQNLEIYRCDKPTGRISKPEFLIHNTTLAKVAPDADLATKLRAISEMVTSVRDPNFAPAIVNRLWKKLMGRGLFDPVDDYTAKCANKALLDWLAYDFMSHDYDLKHTIKLLMTSQAYQLQAITETNDEMRAADKKSPVYVGPPLRRLSSEQFADAVSQLTGYWPDTRSMNVAVEDARVRAWRQKVPDPLALAMGRPTREQVCTARVEDATMIQALEMTNGKVLTERLAEGSKRLLEEIGKVDSQKALTTLYLRAIARPPHNDEAQVLLPLLGNPADAADARRSGWEDALWVICMNPEFQYIN